MSNNFNKNQTENTPRATQAQAATHAASDDCPSPSPSMERELLEAPLMEWNELCDECDASGGQLPVHDLN
jgi:hypothetical protein